MNSVLADRVRRACEGLNNEARTELHEDFADFVAQGEELCNLAASEITVKLNAMWERCPMKLMGFFGEECGYTSARVGQFMAACVREFDELADNDLVSPVARRYLVDGVSRARGDLGESPKWLAVCFVQGVCSCRCVVIVLRCLRIGVTRAITQRCTSCRARRSASRRRC